MVKHEAFTTRRSLQAKRANGRRHPAKCALYTSKASKRPQQPATAAEKKKNDGNGDVPAGSCQVAMFSCYVVSMVALSEHVY